MATVNLILRNTSQRPFRLNCLRRPIMVMPAGQPGSVRTVGLDEWQFRYLGEADKVLGPFLRAGLRVDLSAPAEFRAGIGAEGYGPAPAAAARRTAPDAMPLPQPEVALDGRPPAVPPAPRREAPRGVLSGTAVPKAPVADPTLEALSMFMASESGAADVAAPEPCSEPKAVEQIPEAPAPEPCSEPKAPRAEAAEETAPGPKPSRRSRAAKTADKTEPAAETPTIVM